MVQNLMIPTP